jgi:arylsulfatase A-like enzyme
MSVPTARSQALAHENHARPNVLFLFADDQRADTISAWGNPVIQTPNLDDLVARGMSFRGNYCFGSWHGAVCVPSRAMLMSGRHLFAIDEHISDCVTLPQLLGQQGYTTLAIGKWHNGPASLLRSFQQARSIMLGGMADHHQVPLRHLDGDGKLSSPEVGAKHSSESFADEAVEFLRSYDGDQPFFCYVAFTAPHDPRDPPSRYREMYYDRRPPLPANFLPQHPFDNGQLVLRDENLAPWPRPESVISDQLAEYYGLITHLDQQIGRVLAALANSPHAGDTIIVYAADHGLAMGSHGLLGKQSLYEHSMRCPLILAGPGIPQGKETTAFSYLFDIYPTLCDLLDLPLPEGLAGHTLTPLLTDPGAKVRDSVFLAYAKWMRAVRDDRFKLICYPQINHRQLFDLQNDPDECHDLSELPEHADHMAQLTQTMRDWQQRVGDSQPLEVETPGEKYRDLTGLSREPDQWQPQWIVDKYFSRAAEASK